MTAPVGRPPAPPRRMVLLRIPESKFLELLLFTPNMFDPNGKGVRYGALQTYFEGLMDRDLQEKRESHKEIDEVVNGP